MMATLFPLSMKTIHLIRAIVVVAGILTGGLQAAPSEIGQIAPEFALTDIEGQVHRLSEYRGNIVVLEWVNPLCPFVRKHYESGNIPQQQQTAVTDGVIWLVINSGHPGAQVTICPMK